jgi:hypothetical protein
MDVTIEQMNEAIGVFMGGVPIQLRDRYITFGRKNSPSIKELKYHSLWDWLMPVWKKSAKRLFDIRGDLNDDKYLEAHRITKAFIDACQKVEIERAHEAVYNAVQFIQWYNKQKDNDRPY